MDFMHRVPEAQAQILAWQQAGQLQFREHVLHGIECFPQAFEMIFSGANQGKLLIDLQS
jgi:NADPH-dependent curcumin reductase CurA